MRQPVTAAPIFVSSVSLTVGKISPIATVMSAFDYNDLCSLSDDPDSAREISAANDYKTVQATRCRLDSNGDAIYIEDVPIILRSGIPLRVGERGVYGLVAEAEDRSMSDELLGQTFVMAAWPCSRGWMDHAKFKLEYKDGFDRITPRIEEAFRKNPRQLRDCLEKISKKRNVFPTPGGVAAAVLCDPFPLDHSRQYILGREAYYRDGNAGPRNLHAICDDFDLLREALLNTELLREMVEATFETKDLFVRYHRSLLTHMALGSRDVSELRPLGSPEALIKYRVFDEIANAELAMRLMGAAVDLALAGPEDLKSYRENLDENGKPDGRKLVKHRARDLYLEIYWNLWKRTARARRTSEALPKKKKASLGREEFDRQVANYADQISTEQIEAVLVGSPVRTPRQHRQFVGSCIS